MITSGRPWTSTTSVSVHLHRLVPSLFVHVIRSRCCAGCSSGTACGSWVADDSKRAAGKITVTRFLPFTPPPSPPPPPPTSFSVTDLVVEAHAAACGCGV